MQKAIIAFETRGFRTWHSRQPGYHTSLLDGAPNDISEPPTDTVKSWLRRRQRERCYLCWGKLPRRTTFDHVVPRSAGGKNAYNRLLTHKNCNEAKGSRAPTENELRYLAKIYRNWPFDPIPAAAMEEAA